MADPTLYLFDGYNLLHASSFEDARELRDALASWVAARGVRGILVFDGHGSDAHFGPLEVRYAEDADALLERLAVANRLREQVAVVSSDAALRGTTGQAVRKLSSQTFVGELERPAQPGSARGDMRDRLDPETLAKLERLRRGRR
ncbi:MAG TPA: NYN domain-containing protein [Gaiellaceae bacterium]